MQVLFCGSPALINNRLPTMLANQTARSLIYNKTSVPLPERPMHFLVYVGLITFSNLLKQLMKARTILHLVFLPIIILIAGWCTPAYSQVAGCKDPAATNYNPSATVNDGGCAYNTTFYTPPVKVDPISNVLIESSGLQIAGGFLWSFNDGGGAAAIYRIDTVSNTVLQTVNLGGATNTDWEDIAFDGTSFYVGDFGNNANGARTDLKIYKFSLSDIPDYTTNSTATVAAGQVEAINFTYSDQVPVTATSANNTKFDCEAMIVDGGKIHLFTKNWVDKTTTHYVINSTAAGTYVATPLETLATGYLVTAADKAPNNNVVALLGYQTSVPGNHFLHLLSDYSGGLYFNGNKRRIDLPSALAMGQGEGIAFRDDTYGYISNERLTSPVAVTQKLRSFNTDNFLPAYVLPLQLKQFAVVKQANQNEISWQFSEPVKDLIVEHSTNRRDFATLQLLNNTTAGNFSHQPAAGINCYRLAWKTTDGTKRYSNVVCANNKAKTSFSNFLLRNNGEFSFVFGGETSRFSFRLLTTDGKTMAQVAECFILPGNNAIRFSVPLRRNAVFLLQAIGKEEDKSLLLKVQ